MAAMRRGLGAGLVALGVFLAAGLLANLGGGHSWPTLLLATVLFVVSTTRPEPVTAVPTSARSARRLHCVQCV